MISSSQGQRKKLEVIGEEAHVQPKEAVPQIKKINKNLKAEFNFDKPNKLADVVARACTRDSAFGLSRHLDHRRLIKRKVNENRRKALAQKQNPNRKVKSLRNVNCRSVQIDGQSPRPRLDQDAQIEKQVSFTSVSKSASSRKRRTND